MNGTTIKLSWIIDGSFGSHQLPQTCATTCQSSFDSTSSPSSVAEEPRHQRNDGQQGGCYQGNPPLLPPWHWKEGGAGRVQRDGMAQWQRPQRGAWGGWWEVAELLWHKAWRRQKAFWGSEWTAPHQSPLSPQRSGAAWRSRKCLQLQWREVEEEELEETMEGAGRSPTLTAEHQEQFMLHESNSSNHAAAGAKTICDTIPVVCAPRGII